MNFKRIQLLLTGIAAWMSLLLMVPTTYGASIVIGGNWTDIGTITFVSPKPGDLPTTVGTALLNTLNGITDNSAANPYLIKLGPGIYDLGVQSLHMKEYVDLEGSGENVTIITGNIDGSSVGVVKGANNAEVRFVTVRNTGGGNYAVALYTNGLTSSAKITNVTAAGSGAGVENYGVNNSGSSPTMTNVTASGSGGNYSFGVYNDNASPTMTNVTASGSEGVNNRGINNQFGSSPTMTNVTASGSGGSNSFGVTNVEASPTMMNVTASASGATSSYGVWNANSGTIRINNSVIKGTLHTIQNGAGVTTLVGNTQLDGGAVFNVVGGTLTCVGAYDESYATLNASCQ